MYENYLFNFVVIAADADYIGWIFFMSMCIKKRNLKFHFGVDRNVI